MRWIGGLSHKLGLHWERWLGSERLLSSIRGLSGRERLLGGVGGLSGLEWLLGGEGSLHRERLLAGERGLRLYCVGWLWGLKRLLGSVCRLWLGLLREKCRSLSSSYLT